MLAQEFCCSALSYIYILLERLQNFSQEMQQQNISLIFRVHIVWFLPIESWNVSDFPLLWPLFLFWLIALQQQKLNTVFFRGYIDIDNIFQMNINDIGLLV